MSIFDYRANIVAKLKTSFPQLRTLETHPGKFTLEDVERLCTLAPAAYVSILEAPGTEKLGDGRVTLVGDMTLAAVAAGDTSSGLFLCRKTAVNAVSLHRLA
jgi:phage gp37-like protein